MYVKAIKLVSRAIFPIFAWQENGNQIGVGVAGTGFFINSSGYFVTVAHLFDNKDFSYRYWGQLPENISNPAIELTEISRDDNNDIFLGKISNLNSTRFLTLASWLPRIGKSVCISGYPLANIGFDQNTGFQLGGVRRYFQPSFVIDLSNVKSKTGDKIRDHSGFMARDVGLFGMSGGPIFDTNGIVLGMQGSVSTRTSTNGEQSITVHNAAAIKTSQIISLLEANKLKYNK